MQYASHPLDDTETCYSQTEREALAERWACEHFHYYIYNEYFNDKETDHKPLEKLLSEKLNPPPHIQRWILYLQAFFLRPTCYEPY